jgi:Xaa-Pro aminopeptidase
MKRSHRNRNILLYAASSSDADIYYATRFFAADPFLFVRTARGRRVVVMTDLEIDRARSQSNAHRVLPMTRFVARAREKRGRRPHTADVIVEVLRELGIRGITVPEGFPVGLADRLRRRGIGVRTAPAPFFTERMYKSDDEVAAIRRTMRITETGLRAAVDVLRRSSVRNGWVVHRGRRLTADSLRSVINETIFARSCVPANTIVAPGRQGCDPHETGSGPIRANQPIIVDVFPRSESNRYYADITRTFVKGTASGEVREMYRAVLGAQRQALGMVRHGVRVRDIHEAVQDWFTKRGFETGKRDGRMQGFFHGTGHGLGLDIHEPPRIGRNPGRLESGMVVTVEPGLYYYPAGGVRIEDTVLVTRDGIRNLTRFPKRLEIP